jgi:imidazolonepropionase-like amidohydrolase
MPILGLFEDHAEKVSEFIFPKSRIMEDVYDVIVQRANELGVEIAMGTDAGINFSCHGNQRGRDRLSWTLH